MTPALSQTLRAAHDLLQRGDIAGAARLAEPAARQSDAPEAWHLLGMVRRDGGDPAGARAALVRARDASGGAAEVRNTLGNLLVDMGELDAAEQEFSAAIRNAPSYASAWINRGRLNVTRHRHAQAIADLERAAALDPRSSLALISLGNARRAAGDPAGAVAALRDAVARNPGSANARLHLAVALRADDRPREAVAEVDAIERGGVAAPALHEARAGALLELGEIEAARREVERLVAAYPGHLPGHAMRARLYWEWGCEGDPFESYRLLAASYPREAAIWDAWIGTLMSFRRFGDAAAVAAQADAATGPSPPRAAARAAALGEIGAGAQATRAFESALAAIGRPSPGDEIAFARHLLRMRQPDRAAAMAQRALETAPEDQAAWAYLGTAWRMTGDARELWLHDYERHVATFEAVPPGWEGSAADFAEHAAPVLRALHVTRVHPADQSLRNGTQTPGALFERGEPAIRAIREAVIAAAQRFVAGLPDDPAHPLLRRKSAALGFAGSWSVRLTRHGFHIAHVHSQGWISSACYFALPPRVAGDGARAGWLTLGEPPADLALGLPPRRLIEPAPGRLALFPSSMWHGTVPFEAEGERLTAAFDIVPA